MSSGLTPQQRDRQQTIELLRQRVQHVHGLIERFAGEQREEDSQILAVRRAVSQLKVHFINANFPGLAQTCSALELSARRGTSRSAKARALREGLGTLRFQLDSELRAIQSSRAPRSAETKRE